jgi:2-C-methyl-D-erythritol 4-phosphate cytidylyltransferase
MARATTTPHVAALVVALARVPSRRFTPALAEVLGRPLYAWSVDRLAAAPAIARTLVLLPPRAVARYTSIAAASDWRAVVVCLVALAGAPLANVLLAALAQVDGAIKRILLHDAAYPLLDSSALDTVLTAGSATHLAIAAAPVKDTLKEVDAHHLVLGTPPRERLWQAQSTVLVPRALLEARLRDLARTTPTLADSTTSWLRELCSGLPAHVVPIGADAPHVRTRADARALAELISAQSRP